MDTAEHAQHALPAMFLVLGDGPYSACLVGQPVLTVSRALLRAYSHLHIGA